MSVIADPSYLSAEREMLLGFVQRNRDPDEAVGYGPPKEPGS